MTEPTADPLFFDVQAALAGEYSLIRELGRGGMGVVYLATEVRLAREVAIKVLPPHLAGDPDLREQFVREAQVAARLSHPNIVPIHRVGEAGAIVFFVMMYVPGVTLGERIRTRGPLTPEQAAPLLREVAWALTYAHSAGLVHRDIKPDNILLEQGSGRAMVTDFGIAHAVATTDLVAHGGRVVGTAHYMSPEQAMGEPVDGRSDLYSLGIVAYYALTGRFPIDGDSAPQLLARHVNHVPEPIRSVVPTIPHRLAQAIECCLAKDPAQRYQRASDLADALGSAIEPVRDIAAPVRVWLAAEHENRAARLFGSLYASIAAGVGVASMTGFWPDVLFIAPITFALVNAVPTLVRTRRLFRSGYTLEDLRDGLRRHWVRRREEMAYEIESRWDGGAAPRLIIGMVAGLAVAGLAASRAAAGGLGAFAAVAGAGAVGVTAIAIVRRVKRRMLEMKEPLLLKFWNSRWGEGMARLASLRLQRTVQAPSLPQLTEIALGRASDDLYRALPAATRAQLGDVPATIRRLEGEATRLRDQVSRLESAIGELESDARAPAPAQEVSSGTSMVHDERRRVQGDLRTLRDQANAQLSETVAALEGIRLGLLRMQYGAASLDSITTVLEAARATSREIDDLAAAQAEVERALQRTRSHVPAAGSVPPA